MELGLIDAAEMPGLWRDLGSHDVSLKQFGSACVQKVLTGFQWDVFGTATEMAFYGRTKVLYQAGAGSFARVYRAIAQDNQEILAVRFFGNVFF